MKVSAILDPQFVMSEVSDLGGAFWMVESPSNRMIAQGLWSAGGFDPNSAVFKSNLDTGCEAVVLSVFENIDLHHPDWTEIEFTGAELSQTLKDHFADEGFETRSSKTGFCLHRAGVDP
jgi:hypothetical protein